MKSYAVAVGLSLLTLAACSRAGNPAASDAPAASAEKSYPLRGEVVSVDPARKIAVVQHEDVPGLMPAMTMEFAVSAGDASSLKKGERIRGALYPTKTGPYRLEQIWPDDKVAADTIAAGAHVLREDTHDRGKNVYREVGERTPDFALFDQDGRVVQAAHFRGKQVLLNFIYTRCPVANMCPAATLKMMETQKLARAAKVPNLQLLSVTLDAEYDTPGVLKEYASARGIDTSNFSFLTGPEHAIQDLLEQFGVIDEFEGGVRKHTLTTLLIDENGKIIDRADGSTWEPADFVAKMHHG